MAETRGTRQESPRQEKNVDGIEGHRFVPPKCSRASWFGVQRGEGVREIFEAGDAFVIEAGHPPSASSPAGFPRDAKRPRS